MPATFSCPKCGENLHTFPGPEKYKEGDDHWGKLKQAEESHVCKES